MKTAETNILLVLMGTVLCLAGCLDARREPNVSVPGKATVGQAITTLGSQADNIKPLQLHGQCYFSFFDEDGKRREHNISYKLWLDPPFNIYLQGRAVPGNRGLIIMGSNAREFWLAIQPEINTYWWGRWADVQEGLSLKLSPRVILEALGIIKFEHPDLWTLTHQPGTDVLTEADPTGKVVKRIRVSTDDYLLRNVTYFDDAGYAVVVVDLGVYKYRSGLLLPTEIQIANYADGEATDSVKLHIADGREFSFRPNQFKRREPQGYDKIWRFTAQGFVEDQ